MHGQDNSLGFDLSERLVLAYETRDAVVHEGVGRNLLEDMA